MVVLHTVDGQADHFDVASAELAAQPGSSAQLCGAHGSVVSGVREQDAPSRDERVKSDETLSQLLWLMSLHGRMTQYENKLTERYAFSDPPIPQ